jgi:hypothetical protein
MGLVREQALWQQEIGLLNHGQGPDGEQPPGALHLELEVSQLVVVVMQDLGVQHRQDLQEFA